MIRHPSSRNQRRMINKLKNKIYEKHGPLPEEKEVIDELRKPSSEDNHD